MRAKRGFINYRRKTKGISNIKYIYRDRAHKFYQTSNSYNVIVGKGVVLKQKWKDPVLKLSRKYLKKKSFLTASLSMFYKSTSKPIGIRMGKGKGKIDSALAVAKPNQSIVLLSEASELNVNKLYKLLKGRTSCKADIKLVKRYF